MFCFALQSSAAQCSSAVTLLSPPLTEDIKRRRYEDQVMTDQKSLLHAHFFVLECNLSHAFTVVAHGSYLFWCSGFCFFLGSLIYEKLGEKAFGWPGKCSVFISVTMQNIGGKDKKILE